MKHFYLFPLILGGIVATAQPTNSPVRQIGTQMKNQPITKSWEGSPIQLQSTNCDTFNWPPPSTWNITAYLVDNTGGGFVNGTNKYNDKQKANYFNLGSTSNTFLNKAIVSFGLANSNDLTKTVALRVFSVGGDGKPGSELGFQNITMQTLKDLRTAGFAFGIFTFANPITIPANKQFFISADMSNLQWGTGDSLVLMSNTIQQAATNTAWEQWDDNSWNSLPSAYGINLNFHIYPLTGLTNSCVVTTPIRMASFAARPTNKGNQLQWQTLSENGNAGFEVQRSRDGRQFSAIGFELSKTQVGNTSEKLSYIFTDEKPLPGINYYRLRQLDIDGKYSFSNVVSVRSMEAGSGSISGFYPNPVRSQLSILLNRDLQSSVSVQILDISGRQILQQSFKSAGGQIHVNTVTLKAGMYIVKLQEADGKVSTVRFSKE